MMFRLAMLAIAAVCFAVSGAAATCPFNIQVVTLPPHQVAGFSWGAAIQPMGDACVGHIAVEPTNQQAWYVGGFNGLYMTKNNGATWTKPLSGNVNVILLVPGQTQLVYVGVGKQLFLSRDKGANWTMIKAFPATVQSLLVAQGTLYIGLGWNTHATPSGIFRSNLGGGLMTFHPFGPGHTGLIVWTLSRNPQTGVLFAGTEIFDHPQPYKPPFFRSGNNGSTWSNVAGTLPWHVVSSAVRPNDGLVYALTEGSGTYRSANNGGTWQAPASSSALGVTLLMDPAVPTRLYAGRHKAGTVNGGIFRSTNSGSSYSIIGLQGVTVGGIAMNGAKTRIYAAAYASGVYTSPIP